MISCDNACDHIRIPVALGCEKVVERFFLVDGIGKNGEVNEGERIIRDILAFELADVVE